MTKGYTEVPHEKPYRYREGDLTVTRTSAWSGPGCHLGCGVLLCTDDEGKLVKVEGDPENPFNKGRLCPRCLDLIEVTYNEKRLKYPMRRAKGAKRGEDKWERISWDEAYDEIARRFGEIKDKYGAQAVGFYKGTGRDTSTWLSRLAWGFGSSTVVFGISGMACFVPRVAALIAMTGSFWLGDYSQQFADRYDDPRWKVPPVIILWGNNHIVSNSDGLYGHWVVDCMKRGSKLIVVDPRRTWLANKSEIYLPIRPGADGALALGMLNYIIENDLYDHEFVDNWCYGFDELKEACAPYTLEKTAEITWVPAEKIAAAARLYAEEGGIVQWGVAVDQTKEATPTGQAIAALFEITGNVDKPGAMIAPPSLLAYYGGWGEELLSPEEQDAKFGADKYGLIKYGFRNASTDETFKAIETGEPSPVKGAWLQCTNFLACTSPDPERTLKAFRTMDFIVGIDLFMTPTLEALADIVLPSVTFPERNGLRLGDGVQRGETINRAIEPVGESKPDMLVDLELSHKWSDTAWPWDTEKEMYTSILEELGMDFDELAEKAPLYLDFEYEKYKTGKLRADGQPGFQTTTGRIELWSTYLSGCGLNPLPYYEEPVPGPVSTPDVYEEFPLVLTTGARHWGMFHSEHRQVPRLRALCPWPQMQINPETAREYDLSTGDWAWVESPFGRCQRQVEVTPIVRSGVVSADHGWWLPEAPADESEGLFGLWDVDINQLLRYDPGASGLGSNVKNMLCRIYKVDEEDRIDLKVARYQHRSAQEAAPSQAEPEKGGEAR